MKNELPWKVLHMSVVLTTAPGVSPVSEEAGLRMWEKTLREITTREEALVSGAREEPGFVMLHFDLHFLAYSPCSAVS